MQFLMALALRMGRTLGELQRTLSAGELLMWAEYDRENPIGDVRADIRNAQIVSAIYGSQGVKIGLDEALLQWSEGGEDADGSDPFAGLEEAFMSASK